MSRKRFLIIVEKPSIAVSIAHAYNTIKSSVNYNIDIALANNFIFDINDKYIVRADNVESMKQHPTLQLNRQQNNTNYHIICNDDVYQKRGQIIAELLIKNNYAGIINACDMDEPGDLMFAYTVDSLTLGNYKTIRLNMTSLTEASLSQELQTLDI